MGDKRIMSKDEMKNKYSAFITEISEILGLGKPVDILKLCATTDLFFQPLEKRIAELEKENAELKKQLEMSNKVYNDNLDYSHHIEEHLTDAKRLLKILIEDYVSEPEVFSDGSCEDNKLCNLIKEAKQFLKNLEK
jgi:exonuclease VII small subunit